MELVIKIIVTLVIAVAMIFISSNYFNMRIKTNKQISLILFLSALIYFGINVLYDDYLYFPSKLEKGTWIKINEKSNDKYIFFVNKDGKYVNDGKVRGIFRFNEDDKEIKLLAINGESFLNKTFHYMGLHRIIRIFNNSEYKIIKNKIYKDGTVCYLTKYLHQRKFMSKDRFYFCKNK